MLDWRERVIYSVPSIQGPWGTPETPPPPEVSVDSIFQRDLGTTERGTQTNFSVGGRSPDLVDISGLAQGRSHVLR